MKGILIAVAMGLAFAVGSVDAGAEEKLYIGVQKCMSCHKKKLIGDQYGVWKKRAHSKAFETLQSSEAVKIAKENGLTEPPYESEKCLKCHMTAYGADPSTFEEEPFQPEDGIQCESCHGPCSGYKEQRAVSDHDQVVAAGLWEPGEDEKVCTVCHNDESPSWDPAEGFDYDAAKKKIAHPIPVDVKGRFFEIDEMLEAEKRARGEAVEEDKEE